MDPRFAHIDCWIFDLDNCLYPAACDLFALIDERMTAYVERLVGCDFAEARRIQKDHFYGHGTTLAGLMASHGIDPHEFLDFVHDIDLSRLTPDPEMPRLLDALPGRRFVFTNGDHRYAARVLAALGMDRSFDGIHDIHATSYVPKPKPDAYWSLCDRFGIDPHRALFVEDMAKNLAPAKAIGMATVWVDNGSEQGGYGADRNFVDVCIEDVGTWLRDLVGVRA
ncbi:MAG TPA: pyrimidine 5'-nucleotidase [Sphingomonadaceae bacterium]|nr:pyrimidine 5'-nucleotidase [Sphingomonadaceae bacterium]